MKENVFYSVILAGGSGTRFWPLSRKDKPKQFLDITGDGSLLQITVKRLLKRSPAEHIFIVTNRSYRRQISLQLRQFNVPSANVLCEPESKNTAPSVAWAAAVIARKNPNAVMGVFPSDHVIGNESRFLKALDSATRAAQKGSLVTFGIKPSRPETGYGYMLLGKPIDRGVRTCIRFIEKPDIKKAKQYVKNGSYYWNSGMFVWQARGILEEFEKFLPEVSRTAVLFPKPALFSEAWAKLKSISIDYGVLERSKRVVAVAVEDVGWSDLGSWDSLAEYLQKDKNGNMMKGRVMDSGSRGTFVFSGKKLIATVGLDDLIVVDTPDALLICRKGFSQDVKNIVTKLSDDLC